MNELSSNRVAAGDTGAVPAYFPALDGVRFLCAAGVVVAHAFGEAAINGHPLSWLVADLGKGSVDVFFSLSGFLITGLLLAERTKTGRVDLRAFYIRRTLRIWPVYYVALLLGFGGTAVLGARFGHLFGYDPEPGFFTTSLPAHLVFLGNWTERLVLSPIALLWSVCIEEQFYILFPLTFVFAQRRYPAFRAASLGWLFAIVCRAVVVARGGDPHYNTFAHADNLLAGALLAQVLHARPSVVMALMRGRGLIPELLSLLGFLLILRWGYSSGKGVVQSLLFGISSAVVTSGAVAVFGLGNGPLSRVLSRRDVRYMGALTYATYCFHLYPLAMVWVAVNRFAPELDPWWRGVTRSMIALPLSFFVAHLVRVTFEQRVLNLKKQFQRV